VSQLLGVDAIILVLAAVNGFDVEGVGQDEGQAGGLAGMPANTSRTCIRNRGQAVPVRLDQLEEELEVVVLDVGMEQFFLPCRSMTQTYIWRACRSIPQLYSVVEV